MSRSRVWANELMTLFRPWTIGAIFDFISVTRNNCLWFINARSPSPVMASISSLPLGSGCQAGERQGPFGSPGR